MNDDLLWQALVDALDEHGASSDEVKRALAAVWPDDAGTSMTSWKVDRIVSPAWAPPLLTFEIERHGATVLGSVSGEMQTWRVDTGERSVDIVGKRTVRIGKADARLDTAAMARECAEMFTAGPGVHTDWLTWKDADHVKVNVGVIVPTTNRQTTAARRKRFRADLHAVLDGTDWAEMRPGYWSRRCW